MVKFLFLALLVSFASTTRAQSTATLRGIDIYRSTVLTNEGMRDRFEGRLRQYVSYRNQALPGGESKAEALRVEMQNEAAKLPGVMFVDLRLTEYYTSTDHAMYAMFDVIDQTDASRLAFTPPPTKTVADPDGVLGLWRAYVARGEALSRRGELSIDRPNCPGYYCLWGGVAELDEYQKAFASATRNKLRELRSIFREDADGDDRADALFVLSYSSSGTNVVALCREALSDSDARVRGAALQILADVANHHPELPIGLDRVLPRLDDPSAAVRGKAMGLLVPLAEREAYGSVMLAAAPRLVALMKLNQPESSVLAYTLVGMLSKKNFDRKDFTSWDAWAAKIAKKKLP